MCVLEGPMAAKNNTCTCINCFLPNDKFLDRSKLKAFADSKIKVTEKKKKKNEIHFGNGKSVV